MASFEIAEDALRQAARRAYEIGRLQSALTRGAAAGLLALPGFLLCQRSSLAAICLGGFALVVAAAWVRGEGWAEGARAGAIAGIVPCLLPAAIAAAGGDYCAAAFAGIPWSCGLGGVAAGALLGLRHRTASGLPFWASAVVALGFAASLGCLPAGAMGFAGLAAGVLAGGAPALAARRASA
jgi:hypothetical protein